jgi:multimeric flavodoxin WrbA
MKVIAVNGSPRKKWNTATLLQEALAGAAEAGAETEMINLYELDYTGCRSCFACKLKGKRLSVCAVHDGLRETLEKIEHCDALVVGTPMYFNSITGMTQSFLERLWFPLASYSFEPTSFPKPIPNAVIYTMNVPEQVALAPDGYALQIGRIERDMDRLIGPSQHLLSCQTYQWDYDRYECTAIDGDERKRRHDTVFQEEMAKARELGASLVRSAGMTA